MLLPLPTPSDTALVEIDLNDKLERRDSLKPALQHLSMALEGLTTLHARLSKESESAPASIAPICKLPLETLSCIFEFCVRQDDDAPAPLSSVCRRWKAAATSPGIWPPTVFAHDTEYTEAEATAYLERSRTTLLDIELRRSGFEWTAWFKALSDVRRCRTLEISASTMSLRSCPCSHLPGCVSGTPRRFRTRPLQVPSILVGILHHSHSGHPLVYMRKSSDFQSTYRSA
jgi:hypothetical protein